MFDKKGNRRNYNFAISAIVATIVAVVLLGISVFQCVRINDLRSQISDLESINSQLESGEVNDIESDIRENGVSYYGQDGKTALEILKSKFHVETTDFAGFGEFVNAIGGVEASDTHFWAFYVNGEMSMVGAGEFETSNGDRIEWRLEEIQF